MIHGVCTPPTSPTSGDESSSAPVTPPGAMTPCPLTMTLEIIFRSTGNVISGTTQTKIVGQRVEMRVRTNPGGHSMTDIQWTIPGEKVRAYQQTPDHAVRHDLSAEDLTSADIDYYWIAGGRGQNVQVAAMVDGTRLTAAVSFNVLAPTNVSMTSVTGDIEVNWPGFSDDDIELHYGRNGHPGIAFTLTATAPAGGGGEIAGTQLIKIIRTKKNNAGVIRTLSSSGHFVLDNAVPYSNRRMPIAAASAATWTSDDSPGDALTTSDMRVTINDHFKTYFMYKPSGGIWVTLMVLQWNWSGITTRVGAPATDSEEWTDPTGVSSVTNPSGSASTELPVWDRNVADIHYAS